MQKPVANTGAKPRPRLRKLTDAEQGKLTGAVRLIEDEGLRASLEKLGASILGSRK